MSSLLVCIVVRSSNRLLRSALYTLGAGVHVVVIFVWTYWNDIHVDDQSEFVDR